MHSWLQSFSDTQAIFISQSRAYMYKHKPLYIVNYGQSVGTTSKFVLIKPFIDRSSYQYWFWRGFIASLVKSD